MVFISSRGSLVKVYETNVVQSRVWHWFENDVLIKQVCISETKVI
jgi:hypothetical protein